MQRVSLVTGSARGLGLAVARRLAGRGDRVHAVWRTPGECARELEAEFGPRAHRADLLRIDGARELVERVLAIDGRLDCAVHAVGEFAGGPLSELEPEDLRRMLASNVETAFLLARAALPALRESRGSLVLFGCAGLEGLRARRESAAYAAAKSALLVLARSLAAEEGPAGVRVNVVSPGIVPHPHSAPTTRDPRRPSRIPLGRAGRPEEVAEAVAWLTSDEAGYVTGADLPVSGGWML